MSPFLPPCAVLTCGNSQKSKDADIKGIAAWRRKIIVFAVNLIIQWFQHFSLFILDMFHSNIPICFESEILYTENIKIILNYLVYTWTNYVYIIPFYILKKISFCQSAYIIILRRCWINLWIYSHGENHKKIMIERIWLLLITMNTKNLSINREIFYFCFSNKFRSKSQGICVIYH